jgi:hypothetical protein
MAQERGNVYIASMNMRGKWATSPPGCVKLNVTSAQATENMNRRDFSPMTASGYKGFYNFEAFWQSGKVFEGVPVEKTMKFWKGIKEPKRRFPGSKGMRVLYATWDGVEHMDYVTSRKKVYVPLYHEYMKDHEMTGAWKLRVSRGQDVVVYDFDGPRTEEGDVSCHLVTEEFFLNKINDTRFPFGHGYVVAAHLAGISLEPLCEDKTA